MQALNQRLAEWEEAGGQQFKALQQEVTSLRRELDLKTRRVFELEEVRAGLLSGPRQWGSMAAGMVHGIRRHGAVLIARPHAGLPAPCAACRL